MTLAVIETHPVQYHAPVYRAVQRLGLPVVAIYGSDFSVAGYTDREFGASFAWDTDLLAGYDARFVGRVAEGGARTPEATSARGIAAALREIAPAAVLLVGYSPRFYRDAFLAARALGVPLLFRAETTDHAVQRSAHKHLLRDLLLRAVYHSCRVLLYIGQRSREHYRRLGVPDARLVFAPYCVDASAFNAGEAERLALRRRARAELGLADDQIALLFSGKLIPRKQPGLVVAAIRGLPPPLRARVSLVCLGDGELRSELERQAAQAPEVPLIITGFRNQRQLSPYYHAADLLVQPSKSETWGLVINEALHHGVPCVVSDVVGCWPDLVEPGATGAVFPSGDVAAFTAALVTGLALAERQETRERCRLKVAGYSVERAAAGVVAAYELATSSRSAQRGAR